MKRTQRILLIALIPLLLVLGLFGAIAYSFIGLQKLGGGPVLPPGMLTIVDGFTSMTLIEGLGTSPSLILVDTGSDTKGAALESALKAKGKSLKDVRTVLITHAHPDHIAGLGLLPTAQIYAMNDEVPLAEGRDHYRNPVSLLMGRHNPLPFKVGHPLRDGEVFEAAGLRIKVFAVPGHTAGSAAYLIRGVLFVGDAAGVSAKGQLLGPVWLFSDDRARGLASLLQLGARLAGSTTQDDRLDLVVTSHNGSIASPRLELR